MMASYTITQNFLYWKSCKYADSTECIDKPCGCLRYHINKEEAENPIKSRHYLINRSYGKRMQSRKLVIPH